MVLNNPQGTNYRSLLFFDLSDRRNHLLHYLTYRRLSEQFETDALGPADLANPHH